MRSALVAACVAILVPAAALADHLVTIEHRDMSADQAEVEESRMILGPHKLRMEMQGAAEGDEAGETSMIFRGDLDEVIIVDHRRKTYTLPDKQTTEAMAPQIDAAMKQMEEQLAQMPEEQREAMKKYMQGAMPGMQPAEKAPVIEVKKTDRREKIDGYDCTCYEVLVGGAKSNETWVADFHAVGLDREDFQVFYDMADFYRRMLESLPNAAKLMADDSFVQGMAKIDGFPILVREFEGAKVSSETRFKSIETIESDPAAFEAPEGYARQEAFGRG